MSDKINCPEFTLNPKLPVGVELSLCVLKSVYLFLFNNRKSVLVVSDNLLFLNLFPYLFQFKTTCYKYF